MRKHYRWTPDYDESMPNNNFSSEVYSADDDESEDGSVITSGK